MRVAALEVRVQAVWRIQARGLMKRRRKVDMKGPDEAEEEGG